MKFGLFRKSPYEGLVLARSNGARERRRSTTMMERNKLAKQNEAGSNEGSNWSLLEQRDSSNHTTSDAGSGSSSVDQGSSSNAAADGLSPSQSDSDGNTAASPASQGSGVQDGDHPVPTVQSAPANSVFKESPAEQPTPAAELPQPAPSLPADQVPTSAPAQASPPSTTTFSSQAEAASPVSDPSSSPAQGLPPGTSQSSEPVDVLPPVAAPTSSQEVSPPSATQPLPLTSSLPVAIQTASNVAVSGPTTTELPPPAFPTSSTSVSTPEVLPPAAATTSLPVDAISSSDTSITSTEITSPLAATTTSLIDLANTSTATDSTSTTDPAALQEATTDSVAAQTTITSSPNDVAQTATADSVLTTPAAAALPPVAVQNTAGKDTATSAVDSKASTTSNPPPPPGVTSLPPALAHVTHTGAHTSLPPAAAPFTNKNLGSSTTATAVHANLPLTSGDTVLGADSGISSAAASTGAALSLQRNRPSSFVTSITPIQVADSLPTTANNGISSNQGSGSGGTGKPGTGGNDVNGPNGNGISASIQDHSSMSKTTQAVGFTFIAIGSIALVAGIIYLIRRVLRQRRLGKAYSPPSSPLLNAISDPLPAGIERSMSERSAMGTGKSEFWSISDSNTMIGPVGTTTYPHYRPDTAATYGNENGTYRSELNGSDGGGGMGAFGVRTELNGQPTEWNLDSSRDWDEKMDISPLSPTPRGGLIGGEMGRSASVRVDGMRFEMVGETDRFEMPGDTEFKPNEKPLGRRGGSSENSPNVNV